MNFTVEKITKVEQALEKEASKQAYLLTEQIKNPDIQKTAYSLIRESIIIGARFMQEELMKFTDSELSINDVNKIASYSYDLAIKRGKTSLNLSLNDICNGIGEELDELRNATENASEHITDYTEQQEELADIVLASLTELNKICKGKCLVSDVLDAKINFNKNRK